MLTIKECRKLLGSDTPEKDEDVEALRGLLYGLAESILDSLPPAEPPEPQTEINEERRC